MNFNLWKIHWFKFKTAAVWENKKKNKIIYRSFRLQDSRIQHNDKSEEKKKHKKEIYENGIPEVFIQLLMWEKLNLHRVWSE